MAKKTPPAELPRWFDKTKHSAGTGGIYETATGTLLGEDGEPLSPAVAMARQAALAAEEAQAKADETQTDAAPAATEE